MRPWHKLILGDDDSQTAPICNGDAREMLTDITCLQSENAALRDQIETSLRYDREVYIPTFERLRKELSEAKAEVERLKEEVESMINLIEGYDVCCCGNPVANHGYYDGHSAVSMLDHHISCRVSAGLKDLQSKLSRCEQSYLQNEAELIAEVERLKSGYAMVVDNLRYAQEKQQDLQSKLTRYENAVRVEGVITKHYRWCRDFLVNEETGDYMLEPAHNYPSMESLFGQRVTVLVLREEKPL